MAEQETQGEKPETKATETEATQEQQAAKPVTVEDLQAQLEQLERTAKNKAEEAARVHKKLEAYEKAEDERKRAEMSEMDRIKADLEATQTQLKRAQLDNLKNTIATELGLPPLLASRLQGEDKEAITADAKALLEGLPKPKPIVPATNPGGNASKGETEDQRRARIWNRGGIQMFNPEYTKTHGGGVIVTDKEEG